MLPHRLIAALRAAEHWLDSEFGLHRESTIQARRERFHLYGSMDHRQTRRCGRLPAMPNS
jgi:hypothetical protein